MCLSALLTLTIGIATELEPDVHWSFSDSSGKVTFDEGDGDSSYHGDEVGLCDRRPGIRGLSLELAGDGYVDVDNSILDFLSGLEEVTISLWFRIDSTTEFAEIKPLFYVGTGLEADESAYVQIELGHFNSNNRYIYFTVMAGRAEGSNWHEIPLCFRSKDPLEVGQVYHFAVTVSPSGNKGYLNGSWMEPGVTRKNLFGDTNSYKFVNDLYRDPQVCWMGSGLLAHWTGYHFLDGMIDEVRIWNYELSSEEISNLYQSDLDAANVSIVSSEGRAGVALIAGVSEGVSSLQLVIDEEVVPIEPSLSWEKEIQLIGRPTGPIDIFVEQETFDGRILTDMVTVLHIDATQDGVIDILDLLEVIGNFSTTGSQDADVNGDLQVDVLDLLEIIGSFSN